MGRLKRTLSFTLFEQGASFSSLDGELAEDGQLVLAYSDCGEEQELILTPSQRHALYLALREYEEGTDTAEDQSTPAQAQPTFSPLILYNLADSHRLCDFKDREAAVEELIAILQWLLDRTGYLPPSEE